MIKSKEILSLLDDEFSELNRPIFEWRESNYVGSKCTLLRLNDDNWLLAIHCFEVDSKGPFLAIHTYSNCFSDNYKSIIIDDFALKTEAGEKITYSESDFQQLSEVMEIEIKESRYCVNIHQRNEFQKSTKERAWKTYFRNLFEDASFREALWIKPKKLLNILDLKSEAEGVFETEDWEYPDYLTDPSQLISFQSFAQYLEKGAGSVDVGDVNNNWREWEDYDIE
ncbi:MULTISPECIES: DUF7003 family protein [Bacillus]|uniref:DUF7003 family protein n=1 Tax=Bacillus TaxID=1386 RepID=UPI000B8C367E|nr:MULTISPECIES: hypothetical protein [Bacillus]AZJ42525.1 hypothetical protein EG882_04320 [Bacillus velezensis]MCW8787803.1 hypothetical protein [Bacillus velezensis]MEC2237614.1 hypothetical protein [Bacillus velezensis]MEC2353637.1 hypothetical protein [Bacillus velezensis]MED3231276.1 hypothetical protein [Bacillus velezensis]